MYEGRDDVHIADGLTTLGIHSYDKTFAQCLSAFGCSNFADFYNNRRGQGLNNHWLDVMGGGYSDQKDYDSVTAIRLQDIDSKIQLTATRPQLGDVPEFKRRLLNEKLSGVRKVIAGDIMNLGTWDKVQERLKILKIGGFGVITCRPEGPFVTERFKDQFKPEEYDLYLQGFYEIFSNMLLLLDRGGVMFLQFPGYFNESGKDFAHRVNNIGSLKCHGGGIAYAIERE